MLIRQRQINAEINKNSQSILFSKEVIDHEDEYNCQCHINWDGCGIMSYVVIKISKNLTFEVEILLNT